MEQELSILSFGAGAIGTYVGGSLALSGARVVFLERPAVAAELRLRGIRLQVDNREHRIPHPETAGSLEEALGIGPYDVALFALKSNDTRAALESIRLFAGELPPVLCLQNGVENEAYLAEVLGPSKVIAGTVTSAVGRIAAGDIVLERKRGLGVESGHPLSQRLAAALERAGLNPKLYPNAQDMKWSKIITNLMGNATSAILDLPPAQIFAHPDLFRLEVRQFREALAVMKALGIRVIDLPEAPVRLLAFGATRLPLALARPLMQRALGGSRGGKMPSFHIDLSAGRTTEVEYLNGAVVRAGERAGVPTPVNRALTETLSAISRGELERSCFAGHPEELLIRVGNEQQSI